jgi:predicted nucleic acid-binding protein
VKALFDTNILIDYLRGEPAAEHELARYKTRLISAITWMEILVGATDDAEADVIQMFLGDFTMCDVTRAVGQAAIALRRTHRLRLPDAIIWATARTHSALLVTRNSKDFPASDPGVRIPY